MADKIKTIQVDPSVSTGPHVTTRMSDVGGSSEIGASNDVFVHASERNGIGISPGKGNKVNIQSMPQNVVYGGLLAQQNGLRGMIPSTIAFPVAQYKFSPPLGNMLSTMREVMIISSSFLG